VHRFTSATAIPSFLRKNVNPADSEPGRESSTSTGTPHRPFKNALGSRFRGNDAEKRTCGRNEFRRAGYKQ
jgi:hypothetical protein